MLLRLFIAITLFAGAAGAETRMALVIGNAAYEVGPLANPANDARLAADSFAASGFEVETLIDGDRNAMKRAIAGFAARLKQAGPDAVAAFFYAGHGIQANGRNYLIPVNAPLRSEADLDYETVEAQWVLDLLGAAGARMSIIILDACRNNPFPAVSRGVSRGLARMDAPRGSILAYSTAPGDVAADGDGANSPFTAALARQMGQPGQKVEEMFKQVRRAVLAETGGRQTPWESSSLIGDFFFTPGAAAPQPAVMRPERRPGDEFRDCPECPEMVALAGGRVTLGSDPGEPGHERNEAPRAAATVAPFALGRTEVTRGQFARFAAATGWKPAPGCWYLALVWVHGAGLDWRDTGYPQDDSHAVVCVRWADAAAYADWLSRETGQRYRLPSEAEWEYAARPLPWRSQGDACAFGNLHDRTANATWGSGAVHGVVPCDDGVAGTAPAGAYRPNAQGLFDMIGGVAEWTLDCWNEGHAGRPAGGAPRQDGDCNIRVSKGASFISPASTFRPAFRFASVAAHPNVYLGFRVARELP